MGIKNWICSLDFSSEKKSQNNFGKVNKYHIFTKSKLYQQSCIERSGVISIFLSFNQNSCFLSLFISIFLIVYLSVFYLSVSIFPIFLFISLSQSVCIYVCILSIHLSLSISPFGWLWICWLDGKFCCRSNHFKPYSSCYWRYRWLTSTVCGNFGSFLFELNFLFLAL